MTKCITRMKFLFIILLLISSGCMRVDTNLEPIFNQIKEDIEVSTNQTIYWDSAIHNSVEILTVDDLLQKHLTEEFVVQIALLNNQNLQALYENLGIAKAKLAQAGLLRNPIFSFSYRFATQSAVTGLIDIGLFQNFLDILLIPLKKKTAQAELELEKSILTTQILDVIAATKVAFYTLQSAEQVWQLKQQLLLASELSYEAAQKLFKAGNLKDLEVSMERSLYEQAKLETASWEIMVLEARENLNVLMGLWGHQIDWKISTQLTKIPSEEGEYANIENEAIANSIDLRASYNQLLAVASGFGVDTSKLIFPELDVGVSAEREESIWYVGPAFSIAIPLFDWGQANSVKAESTIMQQWNQYTSLAVDIRSKARSFRFSLLNTFRQSRYLEKVIVPLAEEITHSVLLQHNAMQMGIFHLLSAKRRELETKIQFVQMQKEYRISKVTIQTLLNGHIIGKGRGL